ncbi:MAG: lipocalin family protein [Eggerthellaceae bacterium]|nr:lipocalin family protein [Eggerthellaceae bacterium]
MKKGIIALLACVFALSLSLVGCGGGGGNAADAKAAFIGTWDLVEMEENGEVTGSEDLDMLKALGLDVYLELNEDGTGALVLFGEAMNGTWEAKSATEGTFKIENETVDMKIADSKLTMEQSGAKLTFAKGEARSSSAAAASSEAASSEAASSEAASSASSAS